MRSIVFTNEAPPATSNPTGTSNDAISGPKSNAAPIQMPHAIHLEHLILLLMVQCQIQLNQLEHQILPLPVQEVKLEHLILPLPVHCQLEHHILLLLVQHQIQLEHLMLQLRTQILLKWHMTAFGRNPLCKMLLLHEMILHFSGTGLIVLVKAI
jgi:hypothetical protein